MVQNTAVEQPTPAYFAEANKKTTVESLPDLNDTSYHVSPEQRDEYQRNGHILLRNLISQKDLSPYRHAIVDATYRLNGKIFLVTPWKAFLQYCNIWLHDEKVAKFVLAKRFAKIAADLMGVENVRIYHDAAILKEAGGNITPWHQDQYYFPVDTKNIVTMWMPLVDLTKDMGIMAFATGSHALDDASHGDSLMVIEPDEFEQVVGRLVDERGFPTAQAATMKAGDATFHSGWTMHSAPRNNSDSVREVMTVIYVADGARIEKPKSASQESDIKNWLAGKNPGELVDSNINPVVL